jgi:ABC-type molybdate transport system ATPase subunit
MRDTIGSHVAVIHRYARRFFHVALAEYDLPFGAPPVLMQVLRGPAPRQEQLAVRLGLDEGTISRLVTRLEAEGLVERRPDLGAAWHSVRTRALVCEPKIIMADEPTGNLDSTQGQEIMAILQRLHDEGTTIVMVTHEDEIAQHAERIVTFHDGVIHSDNQVAQRRLARLA